MESDELPQILSEATTEPAPVVPNENASNSRWRVLTAVAVLAAGVAVTAAVGAHREVDRQRESAANVVRALESTEQRLDQVETQLRDLKAQMANVQDAANARDVPNVVGLRLDEALDVLAAAGLDAVIPEGVDDRPPSVHVVARQTPTVGLSLPRGSVVELDLR